MKESRVKAHTISFLLPLILFLLLSPALLFGERIKVGEPLLSGDSNEEKTRFLNILQEATLLAGGLYANYFDIAWKDSSDKADFILEVAGLLQGKDSAVSLVMKRAVDGAKSDSFPLIGEIDRARARFIANIIFYLWASFKEYSVERSGAPPVLIDEISGDALSQSVMASFNLMLMPTSVAVKTGGNLVAGFSSVCLEMDRYFRIVDQPGKQLLDSGNYLYAYGVAVTPGDTIILKPSMGREVYRLSPGMTEPQRWRTGVEVQGPFAVLADGSMVIVDQVNRRATRLEGKKRYNLDIHTSAYSYLSAIAPGPEETFWVYDGLERRIRIYTIDGELIDSIIPVIDQKTALSPYSMAVYANGRFVLFSSGELFCFRRDGTLVWRIKELQGSEGETLGQVATVAVDSTTGLIYLADMMGKRIIKLLDRSYAVEKGIGNEWDEKIAALNLRSLKDREDPAPLAEKALLYEELGAFEMAQTLWDRVLYMDPDNQQAQEKIDQIEVALLKRKAAGMHERTVSVLNSLGPESARQVYSQTVQLYERILSLSPEEEDVKEQLYELKQKFLEKTTVPITPRKPLSIVKLEMEHLFPSLMQYYRGNPAGNIRLKNTLDEEARDVKAKLYIRKYMDFPSESEAGGTLKPGQEVDLPLKVLFNSQIFQLQEDLPVQARVEVTYTVGGVEQSVAKEVNLTIYRRTALSWDDSGKLASFIMPNEGIVSQFAHRVSFIGDLGEAYRISEKFFRAMRICDALGTYNIHYVEDPESPFSKIMGKAEMIDTVRFPRTTLLIRAGDCDDSTALLGSLLESAGIRTAVMTSPGHVFLALDTGEPEEDLWLFNSGPMEAIPYDGRVWVPVETTILTEGFYRAWAKASEIVRTYTREGKIEFLPVYELRNRYPALPLPESTFTVVEPADREIQAVFSASVHRLTGSLYESNLEAYRKKLAALGSDSRQALKVRNQIGILHARFGKDVEAEEELRKCINDDPDFLSSYINLANIKLSRKELDPAISIVRQGLEKKPDSVLLNLLIARIYLEKGEEGQALTYYQKVKEKSALMAERYAALFESPQGGVQVGRAGLAGVDLPLIWDVEE